jgi:UDP-N-acetylglucosamine--N-acetylmuramyl-(pentapeptide) pyrophosphoryl-undecaprenol N-acetylglucosamine transferase
VPEAPTILISAGGTGGGVYPAIAVAEALRRISPGARMYYAGSVGGMEADIVPRELFAGYHEVQSGPLNGVGIRRAVISLVKLAVGLVQSLRLLKQIKPSALFITGGWATFPVAVAAWLRRVPIAIFLPDVEPALAIKLLSRMARLVMATTAESVTYFPPGVTVAETGYPLRAAVLGAFRPDSLAHFKLDPSRKTLLVFGGSRGARSINNALAAILPDLLSDGLQVLHIAGELDWPAVEARAAELPPEQRKHYQPFAYLHSEEMGKALAATDLVVSRAGASTLGEFPRFGLPAILVPYPFAWRYQKVNADWLAARGAAIRLNDEAMPAELLPTIRKMLGETMKLSAMRKASASLARNEAAVDIARKLLDLTTKRQVR